MFLKLFKDAESVIAGSDANLIVQGLTTLAGANTYGGVTTVGVDGTPNIYLKIRSDKALGSPAEGVILYGGGSSYDAESQVQLDVDGIVVKDETLTLAGTGYRAGLHYPHNSGAATWAGDIILDGAAGFITADRDGGTLIVGGSSANTITGNTANFSVRGWGRVVLNSTLNIGNLTFARDDMGVALVNSTNNTWGVTKLAQGTLELGANDALPVATTLNIGKGASKADAIFDLNGKSQRIAALKDEHNTTIGGGIQKILGVAPSTLIVSNDSASTFGLVGSSIEGEVTLVKSGAGVLTLTSTNTTYGSFVVSNGTMVVSATGSFGNNSTNVVVAGGTLTLKSSAAIADTATLSIADGAILNLDTGVNESVAYLLINGAPKRASTYGAIGSGAVVIDNTHFSGSGVLTVLRDTSGTLIILR
ncbi:MAG: hypothetical protein PHO37_16915 [Kiritimatiellae bacterium]|nr:hypothetical protein [Kiritimatiellia bacterium]